MKRLSKLPIIFQAIFLLLCLPLISLPLSAQIEPSAFDIKVHKVEKGETLYSIARKYNVSPQDIKKTNELVNLQVYPGQELVIPGQEDVQKLKEADMATRSLQQPAATPNLQSSTAQPAAATRSLDQLALPYQVPPGKAAIFYNVQKGDDLFSISDSKGVPVAQLKTWNPNSTYREGEQIIIGLKDVAPPPSGTAARSLAPATATVGEPVGDLSSLEAAQPPVASYSVPDAATTRSINTLQPASPQSAPPPVTSSGGNTYEMPELGRYGKNALLNQTYEEYRGPRLSNSRFYALHKTIPVGTMANILLPNNGGFIQVEIVGVQPMNSPSDFALSPEAIKMINAIPNTVTVNVEY